MSSRPVLIQQAAGKTASELLAIAEPLHRRQCARHGLDYAPRRGALRPGPFCTAERFQLLREALQSAPLAVYLDNDAVWTGARSIADALPAHAACGGVRSASGDVNTGALWFRSTPAVLEFLKRLSDACALSAKLYGTVIDQTVFNAQLPYARGVAFAELPRCWNDYHNAAGRRSEAPQVVAFHLSSPHSKALALRRVVREAEAAA